MINNRLTPRSPGLPLLGHALDFRKDPLGMLSKLTATHGDVVGFPLGPIQACLVNHPDYIHRILVTDVRRFVRPPLMQKLFEPFFGRGLVMNEGEGWRAQRTLMQPIFHQRRIASFAQTMVASTRQMLAGWEKEQRLDVEREMMALTMDIVVKTLFGATVAGEAARVAQAMEVFQQVLVNANPLVPAWMPTPQRRREQQAVRTLDTIIHRIINERHASNEEHDDLLSMLLLAQHEDGSGMTDRQVRDEVITLVIAGHETTASTLTWVWHLLSQHSEVEEKLHAELALVLGGRLPTVEDMPKLTYTEMVIKEAIRMYPPAWQTQREATEDVQLGPYTVKQGTLVFICPYLTHRDPRWWDAPDQFDPQRFATGRPTQKHPHAYWPFGSGPRVCIGQLFAMMEAKLVVATLAQQYRLMSVPDAQVTAKPLATLRTANGVPMVVQQRRAA